MNTSFEIDAEVLEMLESLPEADHEKMDPDTLERELNELLNEQNMDIDGNSPEEDVEETEDLRTKLIMAQIELRKFQQKVKDFEMKISELNDEIKRRESWDIDIEKMVPDIVEKSKHEKQRKCKFYERGYCRKGPQCKFRHPPTVCEKFENELCIV